MGTYNDTYNYGEWEHTNTFLSNFATSFKLSNPVADFVAPPILVKRPADKYAIYTKSINRVYQNRVQDAEEPKEISWNVDQGTYVCDEYHLAKRVFYRAKRNTDNIFNLDFDAVRFLKRAQAIAREYRVATIATNTSVVTQTNNVSGAWSTTSGTPVTDILTGMQTITQNNGGYTPNRIVIPTNVALKLIQTNDWKDHFKYTTTGFANGLFSAVEGLRNLGLEPITTMIQGGNAAEVEGVAATSESIWGNNVLLFYCEPNPTLETRTFMYSPYTIRDLIQTFPEPKKRSDLHMIFEEIDELVVDTNCAYSITNTL